MSILTSLRRPPRRPEPVTELRAAQPTEPPVMRFLTHGGAEIVISHLTETHRRWRQETQDMGPTEVAGYRWRCLGCDVEATFVQADESIRIPGGTRLVHRLTDPRQLLARAREAANLHADVCRSMPKPDGA